MLIAISAVPSLIDGFGPMKLYAGTTEQFRTDAQLHRIADKLRAEYIATIGYQPGPGEVASWQNSLMALSMLVDQAELPTISERSVVILGRERLFEVLDIRLGPAAHSIEKRPRRKPEERSRRQGNRRQRKGIPERIDRDPGCRSVGRHPRQGNSDNSRQP